MFYFCYIPQLPLKKIQAVPHSLATTKGIVCYFIFLQILRCFSSLSYLPRMYFLIYGIIKKATDHCLPPSQPYNFAGTLRLSSLWTPRDPLQAIILVVIKICWKQADLNPRPLPCKGSTIPAKLCSPRKFLNRKATLGLNQEPYPYQGYALTN